MQKEIVQKCKRDAKVTYIRIYRPTRMSYDILLSEKENIAKLCV